MNRKSIHAAALSLLVELRNPPLLRDYTGGYTGYTDERFCPVCLETDGEHRKDCLFVRAAGVIEDLLLELGVEV